MARLRGSEEGEQRRGGRGEGAPYIRGLYIDTIAARGLPRFASTRDCQSQYDRADDPHLRRGSNPNLYADAQRLISQVGRS